MTDIFLHHYPKSPFAEKIRLVLGYKGLAWKSVVIPDVMPKPDLVALTGGYRKTPVLQVGADIYCDTALICDVLEHLHPTPSLYPSHKGLSRVIAQWADEKLFWAAMGYNFAPQGAAQMFARGRPPEQWQAEAKAFSEDRAKMRVGVPRLPQADASAAYRSYLRRINNMLEGLQYLLGAEPCLADFAVYHPLWFTRTQTSVMAGILDATPAVLAWMDRMAAVGHGRRSESDATESIAACANGTRADSIFGHEVFQDEHRIPLGSEVSIASDSFGPEPSVGTLVSATRMHYTIRRTDPRAGMVQVHFPRIGYILKKAESPA
jgi:glutathione S-transferase